MITIREENAADISTREALLDEAFGIERFEKTCERLRAGRVSAQGLALVAEMGGIIVGTVRLWHIQAGSVKDALVLGPLAVSADVQSQGVGSRLMRAALNRASLAAYSAVLLVGDAPYYSRFGFSASLTDGLWMPGPVERERFLALELKAGSLSHAFGLVKATGEWSVVDTSSHEFNIAGNGLRNAA
jgi:predicted N-acetyltransferase YhbS